MSLNTDVVAHLDPHLLVIFFRVEIIKSTDNIILFECIALPLRLLCWKRRGTRTRFKETSIAVNSGALANLFPILYEEFKGVNLLLNISEIAARRLD